MKTFHIKQTNKQTKHIKTVTQNCHWYILTNISPFHSYLKSSLKNTISQIQIFTLSQKHLTNICKHRIQTYDFCFSKSLIRFCISRIWSGLPPSSIIFWRTCWSFCSSFFSAALSLARRAFKFSYRNSYGKKVLR